MTITNWQDDSIVFEQRDVEFPTDWSINASNIVTQKYFWGALDRTKGNVTKGPFESCCEPDN